MIYLKRYKKEYGILYLKPVFPKEHKLRWLNYACGKSGAKDLDSEIEKLSNRINEQYSKYIIIKMDKKLHPGCVTTPDMIDEISLDIYNSMCDIYKRLSGDKDIIRLVYGIGELEISKDDISLHHLDNFPILVKVGHKLDSSKKPGIFKV